MAAVGTIRIAWSNGEDDFCIAAVGSILQLEEKCDAGIAAILHRLQTGQWRLNDVRETIRLALIGGGMPADKAMTVVKLHVDAQPWAKNVMIAHAVIAEALVGPKEVEGEVKKNPTDQAAAPESIQTTAG